MSDDTAENLAESLEAELSAIEGGAGDDGDDGGGASASAPMTEEERKRDRNLSMIMDIPLKVTVQLGQTRMVVSELLNLGQGSVIELTKLAGEPMEVLVNDKLVARGEAVVVNEKFGVRLTDIISQSERVEQLG
ncbi:MAG: flagellar motor switch protein FliN [Bdellovibrionaceae bacterium]|nr:flagellar motor switch protein FliN [Pseudobdellovibrionaceae bacterium]